MVDETHLAIGQRLRHLRKTFRNLTQEELAERCKLSPDAIRRLEQGKGAPSLDTLLKLSSGLGLDLVELLRSPRSRLMDQSVLNEVRRRLDELTGFIDANASLPLRK